MVRRSKEICHAEVIVMISLGYGHQIAQRTSVDTGPGSLHAHVMRAHNLVERWWSNTKEGVLA